MTKWTSILLIVSAAAAATLGDLENARNKQDRAALDKLAAELTAAANQKPKDAKGLNLAATALSYSAEVALELKDKGAAKSAAESGIQIAQKAVALTPDSSEAHRILGTLCGQVIPANVLAGIKYGRCAQDEITKALELDPKSAAAYVSRGVGNYYLPPSFGGGVDTAIKDFEKAVSISPKSADAYMWMGIALRKANRNAEARKALAKSLELNPQRIWTKQQLEKTPEK